MEKVLGGKKALEAGGIMVEELAATECRFPPGGALLRPVHTCWPPLDPGEMRHYGGSLEYALHVMQAGHTFPVAGTKPSNHGSHVALALLRLEKKCLLFWATSHPGFIAFWTPLVNVPSPLKGQSVADQSLSRR